MSTAGLDLTSFLYGLKELYSGQTVENLIYQDNPLLAVIEKTEKGFGKYIPIPIAYGPGGSRSKDFSQAQTLATSTATKGKSFLLTPVKDYAVATIDGILMATAANDATRFVDEVKQEIETRIQDLKNTLGRDMYRSGWGDIGVIGSISSATITLATPSDVNNFETDQVCVFSSAQSSATLRNSGGSLTVQSVDRDAGTVTFTAAVSTVTGTAAGDYVFIKGDRQDSATPTARGVSGLAAWLPSTAPASGDSFFGVDRSVDAVRLAGLRYAPGAGTPLNQVLSVAAQKVQTQGGRTTHFFMHPDKMNDLINGMQSHVVYSETKVAALSFRGVELQTGAGTVTVMGDRNCPKQTVYGLDKNTWKVYTTNGFIHQIDDDGRSSLRQSTADGIELRFGYYAQVGCNAPGRNIAIALAD